MSPDKLVHMANQIGKFFATSNPDGAASAIGNHIAKFWEPRMRKQMYAHLAQGGAGLDPLPKQGLEELRRKDPIEQASAN